MIFIENLFEHAGQLSNNDVPAKSPVAAEAPK